jgi:hypothetical protein
MGANTITSYRGAYYCPDLPCQLLSPQHWAQQTLWSKGGYLLQDIRQPCHTTMVTMMLSAVRTIWQTLQHRLHMYSSPMRQIHQLLQTRKWWGQGHSMLWHSCYPTRWGGRTLGQRTLGHRVPVIIYHGDNGRVAETKFVADIDAFPKLGLTTFCAIITKVIIHMQRIASATLNVWIDVQLQQVLYLCPAYLKDSWHLLLIGQPEDTSHPATQSHHLHF